MNPGILHALGGLGLFLLGMAWWTDGLRALAGGALRGVLTQFTRSPLSGAVTGAASTAVVQSSSVTTVAAVGFVGAGLLTFPQALGIIFGANVGSTVTGWIVAILGFRFEIGTAVLPLVFVAALLALLGSRKWARFGGALGGFCLIFLGISYLQEGMAGLQEHLTPASLPEDTIGGRLLLVAIGLAVTIVTQSSAAGVAMAMSALAAGAITWPQAAALVIGMDIGTTATAFLATIGASISARRTGYAHVVFNLFTAVGALLVLSPFAALCDAMSAGFLARDPEIGLVAFHSTFNLIGTVVALPFAGAFARMIVRLVPSTGPEITDPLDANLLRSPELAVAAVGESLRRASRSAFAELAECLGRGGWVERDSQLEQLEGALLEIQSYLERLPPGPRSEGVERPYTAAVHVLDHLERLVERIRRGRTLAPARIGPELADLCRRLSHEAAALTSVTAVAAASDGAIRALWEELDRGSAEARKEVLRRCVAGELSLDAADDRLDAHRWLRRATYHVWRIRVHLGEIAAAARG